MGWDEDQRVESLEAEAVGRKEKDREEGRKGRTGPHAGDVFASPIGLVARGLCRGGREGRAAGDVHGGGGIGGFCALRGRAEGNGASLYIG